MSKAIYTDAKDQLFCGHIWFTIRSPVQDVDDGIKNGSICFHNDDVWPGYDCPSKCGLFDLATSKITWPNSVLIHLQVNNGFFHDFLSLFI